MNNLVVIPARGGSKGIPGKNIKIFKGKPLILHAVDAAKKIFNDNEIIVSTDDIKIKEVVEDSGLVVHMKSYYMLLIILRKSMEK